MASKRPPKPTDAGRPRGGVVGELIDRVRGDFALKAAVVGGLMVVFSGGYVLTQYVSPVEPVRVPTTWLDRAIPFAAWWVWPYVSLYAFIPLAPALTTRRVELRRYAATVAITAAVSFAFFVVMPTAVDRAYLDAGEPMNWAMRVIVRVDRPVNALPSLHAGLVVISLLLIERVTRRAPAPGVGGASMRLRWWVLGIAAVWSVAILLGTLGTKQHHALDLLAGAAVAGAAHWFVWRRGDAAPVTPAA